MALCQFAMLNIVFAFCNVFVSSVHVLPHSAQNKLVWGLLVCGRRLVKTPKQMNTNTHRGQAQFSPGRRSRHTSTKCRHK